MRTIRKAFTKETIYNYYVNGVAMNYDEAILASKSCNTVPHLQIVKSGLPLETKCGIISVGCMMLGLIATMVTM